jgi:hypothetical protein
MRATESHRRRDSANPRSCPGAWELARRGGAGFAMERADMDSASAWKMSMFALKESISPKFRLM